MQVARWGNSLAVRLPAVLVQPLGRQESEASEQRVVGGRTLEVAHKAPPQEWQSRLRRLTGSLPAHVEAPLARGA